MKKVLVAMSGGVDSSAVAAMLLEQGYTVAGATMQLWQPGEYFEGTGEDPVAAARQVAKELGITHYVFDLSAAFRKEVVEPFMSSYANGLTPNPCVFCNRAIKFGAFLERALELGYDTIATGHYGKITKDDRGIYHLHPAHSAKDQSYVLYQMNQEILSHLMLPLYGVDKDQVRLYAKRAGISVSDTPDSQEICFIPDKDYAGFLERMGLTMPTGDFVDQQGHVMGVHKGLHHYTVGQRKGLGAFGSPKYVLSLNPENNQVVLGENQDLFGSVLTCHQVNWLSGNTPDSPLSAGVKIRYSAQPASAVITPTPTGVTVTFDTPQRAITPGQSAVFYRDGELIGGGIITGQGEV